ncbi:MAG: hypothetical protein ACK4IK_07145 [Bacteroidia bacterium]
MNFGGINIFNLIILFLFVGCSWQEYFLIANHTNKDISITYTLAEIQSGFPIFTERAEIFKMNKSGDIIWENRSPITDLDTSLQTVKVILHPNCILNFGHLSNDHYSAYNQYFINDRKFNLEKLFVNKTEIIPETFDKYFKKDDGSIVYRIK